MAEIVAIVASLVGPVIEIGKCIVSPIKRQFTYLCCFDSSIQNLRDEAEKLDELRARLQGRVEAAKNNAEVILPAVETWLENASNKIQVDKSGIDVEIENVKRGCFSIKSRILLSKKAKKTTKALKDLQESCKFDEISVLNPQGPSDELESRKQIEEEIMEDLRGRNVHMMGICGMGGVGKTIMAKNIMDRVRQEQLFDEVVMVVVGLEVRMLEIQRKIAEKLDLKLNDESLSARTHRLRARLTMPRPKRILLILDDIWARLDLVGLGIPLKSILGEGCTIVLTSRTMDVLSEMNAKPYPIKILSQKEAWFLFREEVGTWIDDSDLLSVAKEIVQECKGLPLALATVGTALKNDKSKRIWEHFAEQLKCSNPIDIPDFLQEVYNPIKLSYDFLDNQDARSLFLLCCLFPEGYDIHLDYLTYYGIGLRMFGEIRSVEEVRNRVRTLFKMLKACFLLLDGRDENHVRMHDVVHDVAIFTASEERLVDRNLSSREESINCTWISVYGEEINKLPIRLNFPSLRLLKIDNYSTEIEINSDPSYFQGMIELNVLSFRSISFRSLPKTTTLLKNLRTLYLIECDSLETISIVGELLSLEILICHSCHKIEELPVEIGGLKQLRLLEVYKCRSLKRIVPGVISNLVQLKELMIVRSFGGWETKEANGEQRENAAICEIEHLKNLTRLEIEIEDTTVAADVICLPSDKVKYNIRFGGSRWESSQLHENGMIHKFEEEEITFGKWIKVIFGGLKEILIGYDNVTNLWCHQIPPVFFSQLEELEIYGSSSNKILFSCSIAVNLVNLRELRISKCKEMVKVFEDDEEMLFPSLYCLYLADLPKLKSFCNLRHDFQLPSLKKVWIKGCHFLGFFTIKNVLFRTLEKIIIRDCNNIRSLFSSPVAENLDNLKILSIFSCKEMVQVIDNDAERYMLFPKLKVLDFGDLPKLQSFCNRRCNLQLPSLKKVDIYSCPLFKKFSMGSIITPSLKKVEINTKLEDMKTLNGGIQLHSEANQFHQLIFTAKESTSADQAKHTEADHKKDEIEEEENKQEINEESTPVSR